MSVLRETFVEGLVTLTPITLFFIIVWWIYSVLSSLAVVAFMVPPALRVVVVFVLFAIILFVLGRLMRTAVGRLFDRFVVDLINRFPVVRVLYNAIKRTMETFVDQYQSIQQPVKIELWEGCRMAAFKTGHRTADGKVVLFIPGAPEISAGFVAAVDPDKLIQTDESLMDVLVRLLSCGYGEGEQSDR